jgi:site-specific DNA-methyltransferase (adenine-specific)
VSRRENHDASAFYDRFVAPEIDEKNDDVVRPSEVDSIIHGDARRMTEVADGSVALVVTSPPYFAGKAYEEALGQGHIPETYTDYLAMLRDVFAECVRTLEPGGRIAVNVANLGRKPYRSLSADVIGILQDDLRLLLRGEIVWIKARGSAVSCAWGSFQRPANPVLRDLTERVIIASKGRFDRAIPARKRERLGLPSAATLFRDNFMDATTDVWEIAPESATRVGHPAPFPVELPDRLINLYTYHDDLVLDPFMGSGTTAVAAVRSGRRYVGYDTDADYIAAATSRIEHERARLASVDVDDLDRRAFLPAVPTAAADDEDFQARAVREGKAAKDLARQILEHWQFHDLEPDKLLPSGVEVNFVAKDRRKRTWYFDVSGAFSSTRPGLRRTDTLWKAIGKAAVIHAAEPKAQLVLLTTDAPAPGSAGAKALAQVVGPGRPILDVIQLLSRTDQERLGGYVQGRAREG